MIGSMHAESCLTALSQPNIMKCRCCNKLDLVFDRGPVIPYPPPCDNLLLSQTIPSPLDQNDVKHSISDIVGRLSRLEKHTEQLDALARELEAAQRRCAEEHGILEEALLEYQSVVTPIRMIPDDVLSEIFVAQGADRLAYSSKSPLVLAGVCRRWRSVCLSMPCLWTHFHATSRSGRAEDTQDKANLMRIFTNRSGACPMQVTLDMDIASSDGWGKEEEKTMLVNEIIKSAGRWQALEICFSGGSFWQLQRVLDASQLQLFKTLEILRIVANQDNVEPLSIFACAPRLKRVTFNGPSFPGLKLPWGQIENLTSKVDATSSSMQFLVATLAQCPNLVHGYFGLRNGGEYDDDDDQVSSHLAPVRINLQSCIIEVPGRRMFQEFFDGLDLPSLSVLHIYSRSYVDVWSQPSFSHFMQRSCCTLKRLTLEIKRFPTSDLLEVLTVFQIWRSLSFTPDLPVHGHLVHWTTMSSSDSRIPLVLGRVPQVLSCSFPTYGRSKS
ncbi:hypothetical protein FIBSPDRAFT_568009 [Athelia psychrophila]|uniref:Uncharacterized protein n=1 Tax=Athelia psychrophila TaxID=1759441 RepID=A0A166HUZ6_9AGAM|nr:hypothetical protein FIBSPDRAFT_568009 [Fibularhizoctonia sp. CBS 109695]